jgi:predicted metal-binding protein
VVTQNCLADDAMLVWLVKKTILVMTCWQYLFELHCYSCFFCLRSEKGTKGEGKWRGSSNFCGSQIMSHWKPNRQSHFEASVQLFKVQYCCDIRGRQVKRLNKTLQSERHQQRPFLDAFVCLRPKPITETTSHESYEMILKLW